jgi:two-component system, NarL family, competent response regulator ComA
MKQILLVDDHPSVMEGTKMMLEREPDFHVTIAGSESHVMELVRDHSFDVMLFDLHMPDINGLELAKKVFSVRPEAIILMYSGFDMKPYLGRLLEVGVVGFISKTSAQEQLVTSIRCALRGEAVIPVSMLKELSGSAVEKSSNGDNKQKLSGKEVDILKLIAEGKSNKEIAQLLLMSQRSLEYCLTQLFQKLHVKSRIEAVSKSKELGFQQIPIS